MGIFTSFMSNLFSTALLSKASHPKTATATAASTAANVIDTLFTSEEERLDKQTVLARVALHADALQSRINTAESQHRSRFVAGWRPFIGWVCGMALAWHFILLPLCQFGLAVLGIPPSSPAIITINRVLLDAAVEKIKSGLYITCNRHLPDFRPRFRPRFRRGVQAHEGQPWHHKI